MKHFKIIFRTILLLSVVPFKTTEALAYEPVEYYDSVEVSLLTCQPHDEVYSLYGHTALRWHDLHKGKGDIAFNWGVFDFKKPHFVARFVFGLTDYELGGFPYQYFKQEYRRWGSMVTEQVLNLTAAEKQKLQQALEENLRDENRIYRYNYFYNNCTTKARDIIEKCIDGRLEYAEREDYSPSYRDMVHLMTERNPWARFGNDVLLGIKADQTASRQEQEFLPNNLMYDFDHAQIYTNGNYRPLVKERRIGEPPGVQIQQSAFPLTPWQSGMMIVAIGLLIFAVEWKMKRSFLVWDLLLMVTTGVFGIVLTLMLFSQHPTVSLNLQILLLNPLPWFFLLPVIKGRGRRYWLLTSVLTILFLMGGLFQSYAEGIQSLACCLLLQSCIHLLRKS